jgi:hypothetical protein
MHPKTSNVILTVGDPCMSSLEPLSYPRQVQARFQARSSCGQPISNPGYCMLVTYYVFPAMGKEPRLATSLPFEQN